MALSSAGMASLLGVAYVTIRGDMSKLPHDLAHAGSFLREKFSGAGLAAGLTELGATAAAAYAPMALVEKALEAFHEDVAEGTQRANEFAQAFQRLTVATSLAPRLGKSANQLKEFALELDESTGSSAASIMEFQAHLAQFSKVHDEVFMRATRVAVDWSELYGRSLPEKARILGMALQDPARGMQMLRRAQVQLSQEQEDTIENLVSENRLLEAQGIILNALEKRFAGAAEKMVTPTKLLNSELETQLRLLGDSQRKLQPLKITAKIVRVAFEREVMDTISKELGTGILQEIIEANPKMSAKVAVGTGVGAGRGLMPALGMGGIMLGALPLIARGLYEGMGYGRANRETIAARKKAADEMRKAGGLDDADRKQKRIEGLFDPKSLISTIQESLLNKGNVVELGQQTMTTLTSALKEVGLEEPLAVAAP